MKIPPVAVGVLAAGGSSQVPFHVSLECESGAVSSPRPTISAANIAMGFVVNQPTAVAVARRLGNLRCALRRPGGWQVFLLRYAAG
ncbi:hypothetical protein HGH33_001595 [Salmonella enterica]|nr:hypothetical protein [Salmonella enterica subsp. enterica serovar Chailey]EJI6963128.1 hypothetical protein [Salmonella enterica subsp. enterica serovar Chailey]